MSKRATIICTVIFSGLLAATAFAQKQIQVVGLFANKAVVIVDGKQHLLSIGETSPEGVQLLRADSQSATLRFAGQTQVYPLSQTTRYAITAPAEAVVSIAVDDDGLYRIDGFVDRHRVTFIVDTGASHVAMNAATAQRLDIDYRQKGQRVQVTTAAGKFPAYVVTLKTVKIGNIIRRDVTALVLEGNDPEHILLGMSFLEHFKIQQYGKLLQIKQ